MHTHIHRERERERERPGYISTNSVDIEFMTHRNVLKRALPSQALLDARTKRKKASKAPAVPRADAIGRQIFVPDAATDLMAICVPTQHLFPLCIWHIVADYVVDDAVLQCVVYGLGYGESSLRVKLSTRLNQRAFLHVGNGVVLGENGQATVELVLEDTHTKTCVLIEADAQVGTVLHLQGIGWNVMQSSRPTLRIKRRFPH